MLYFKLVTNLTFYHFIIFTINFLTIPKFYFGFGGTDNARIRIDEPGEVNNSGRRY